MIPSAFACSPLVGPSPGPPVPVSKLTYPYGVVVPIEPHMVAPPLLLGPLAHRKHFDLGLDDDAIALGLTLASVDDGVSDYNDPGMSA